MTGVICISGIAAVILSFIMLSNFLKVHVSEELCNVNYAIRANNIENGVEYNNGISGYISHDYKSDFCTVLNVDNDS
jgi:methyl coenzyme M reductase subunit C